jgi:hypothetical protein
VLAPVNQKISALEIPHESASSGFGINAQNPLVYFRNFSIESITSGSRFEIVSNSPFNFDTCFGGNP